MGVWACRRMGVTAETPREWKNHPKRMNRNISAGSMGDFESTDRSRVLTPKRPPGLLAPRF
jgi:hypothetical protein